MRKPRNKKRKGDVIDTGLDTVSEEILNVPYSEEEVINIINEGMNEVWGSLVIIDQKDDIH